MHSFEACSDAKDFVKLFTADCRMDRFVIERHVKLDKVATTTEKVFIAGCCECIEDIPDTVTQASAAAKVPIFTELIDNMVKQLKKLGPSPLREGVNV
jgi:heterodisulfide reductase subunit A-like polyferredoxin